MILSTFCALVHLPITMNMDVVSNSFSIAITAITSHCLPVAFGKVMNKEDKRDYVLAFPSYLKDFVPDLWLTPNGLLRIPGKTDHVIFDASFLLHMFSRTYNNSVSLDDEPAIIFGQAWFNYL